MAAVHLFHVGTPTCWWTYGYLGVVERVRELYGDQLAVHTYVGCVYDDREQWLEHEELDDAALQTWADEAVDQMGVPLAPMRAAADHPPTMQPATDAVWAAYGQGHGPGDRFFRELLRLWNAESVDPNTPDVQAAAAEAAGLDVARFHKDLGDAEALDAVAGEMGQGFPHVGLGFYNLAIGNGDDTWVVLNHAFDPARVERAIEFIGGGELVRTEPTDIAAYLKRHGACSIGELAKVFGQQPASMEASLTELEKAGRIQPVALPAGTFWSVA